MSYEAEYGGDYLKHLEEKSYPSEFDKNLHKISLDIAEMFHRLNDVPWDINKSKADLIEAYRDVRRLIGVNPETGKRHGSRDAYLALRGDLSLES